MILSLKYIRKINYLGHRKRIKDYINVDTNNWYKNPYTAFKARFYSETSSVIVFILQYTKITPNFLTLIYAFLGAISGIFLASNNQKLIFISLIILFTKGSLDWADGLLARIKKRKSELGDLLDNWAGLVGIYSYLCGFGIYLYNKNGEENFILLVIIIILIKSLDLKNYAYQYYTYKLFHKDKKKLISRAKKNKNKYGVSNNLIFIKLFFENFLDERSRTVDFICLLILIDAFFINIIFLNYLYYLIFLRAFILFCGGFYITYFKNFFGKIK